MRGTHLPSGHTRTPRRRAGTGEPTSRRGSARYWRCWRCSRRHRRTAASRLVVSGAGFGHGVGMSQYGAFGFARNGADHASILAHYYAGTELTTLDGTAQVRVLLKTAGRILFTKAAGVVGGRRLDPAQRYVATRGLSGIIALRSSTGRELGTYRAPLAITGTAGGIRLFGRSGNAVKDGRYRGNLEVSPSPLGGVTAINAVGLEDYVRGVVAGEMPSTWPARGAARAGDRRAHVRDLDEQGGRRLRPVRRHALAGLQRDRRRDQRHRRGRRRDRGQRRHVRGQAGRDVLLLDVGRTHREHRERVPRRRARALPDVGRRSLRRRLAAPSLDAADEPRARRSGASARSSRARSCRSAC